MSSIITPERLNKIKTKIDDKKVEKAKAEGALESIQSTWKKEYSLNNAEEVKAKIADLQQKIDVDEKKLAQLSEKIEAAVDWDDV